MQKLPEIKAAYNWLLSKLEAEIQALTAAGDLTGVTRFDTKRDILERGVFVLMFGQFEVAVNDVFATAREARVGNPDWTRRRGWDAAALQGDRVPFETRLAMVLDRRSPHYGRVLDAYGTRNHCAHGGTSKGVGSIDRLYADLFVWRGALRG